MVSLSYRLRTTRLTGVPAGIIALAPESWLISASCSMSITDGNRELNDASVMARDIRTVEMRFGCTARALRSVSLPKLAMVSWNAESWLLNRLAGEYASRRKVFSP